jgi:hypothetical protein
VESFTERPCAAPGLTSFRYRGPYGYIMIGARTIAEALREAARSTDDPIMVDKLEVWKGNTTTGTYVPVGTTKEA